MVLLMSCREGPDRTNGIQVPLALYVLGAPVLSYAIRRRDSKFQILIFTAQIVAYIVYETGISIETNIRSDLPLFLVAFVLNVLIVLRGLAQYDKSRSAGKLKQALHTPSGYKVCDGCKKMFPSHHYLEAVEGHVGYFCRECR
jgi:hypothetical protein